MINESKEIRLAGLGGQGVVMAGLLLGQAAILDGLFAAGSNSYGAQARGSAARSDVVVGPEAIDYPHVESPDLLVAMSQGALDAYLSSLAEGGMLLYDAGMVDQAPAQGHGLKITDLALEELGNRQVANVLWVGVIAGYTGWVSPQAVEKAVAQHVPPRFIELNQKALAQGMALGKALKES